MKRWWLHGSLMLGLLGILTVSVDAEDWPRFRGDSGNGIASSAAPESWSPEKNLTWKTALPGAGASSPIVVGDHIVVTCYSGYGLDRGNPGNLEDLRRHVVCVNRADGKIAWQKTIDAVQPEDPFTGIGVPAHGYASNTPVSDGKHIYAFLGKSGVYCYDLEGNEKWHTSVGTGSDDRKWGSGSSPVLFRDLVIVPAICESTALIALDKTSGKEVWRYENDGFKSCWGTPSIIEGPDGQPQLVMGVPSQVWAFDPATGKLKWTSKGAPGDSFYTSVSVHDGMIFASAAGRSGGGTVALKIGSEGELGDQNLQWQSRSATSFGSPVVANGQVYMFSRGVATALDAKTGEEVKQTRLPSSASGRGGGSGGGRGGRGGRGMSMSSLDYASPVAAGDKIYYLKGSGDMLVFSADKEFKQLASNRVTADSESFYGTPAIVDGQIFMRSSKHLYCVGSK